VVHHYGERPEFVVLGGLVPELLCSGSAWRHIGTTDVDVQVDLEIAAGATNMERLERALRNAEFKPDSERVWRWMAGDDPKAVVKFELLADLSDVQNEAEVRLTESKQLGAVNLRGTGFAARDVEVRQLHARIADAHYTEEINVSGLAGFLLAKTAAAYGRRKPKDWYDIAFVLLHNDTGGPQAAAERVLEKFRADLRGGTRTSLLELRANFTNPTDQGPRAYADQMRVEHPELNRATLLTDAVLAVELFCGLVLP
jgi:hypothetical protein